MLRVIFISEIRLFREGLSQELGRQGRLRVIATHSPADFVPGATGDPPPDAALIDCSTDGVLAEINRIVRVLPRTKVVALCVPEVKAHILRLAEAGITGFVFLDESLDTLTETVEDACRGQLRCTGYTAAALLQRVTELSRVQQHPVTPISQLSRRELEVAWLLEQGLSNKRIAHRLGIEVATVKNHVHRILTKMDASTRWEVAARVRSGDTRLTIETS